MLQHTDGSVVNFNGGSKFSKEIISQLISKSNSTIKSYNGITKDGFSRMNLKSTSIFFDTGNPNNKSENWHAGTLSFELSYLFLRLVFAFGAQHQLLFLFLLDVLCYCLIGLNYY